MNFGIHIEGRKERVKGTRRGLLHKGIVNGFMVYVAVLFVNMAVFLVNL